MAATSPLPVDSTLLPISPSSIAYFRPKKRIFSHNDLAHFPSTPAYKLLTSFLTHLSASVTPLSPHTGHLRPPSDFYTNNPKLFITEPAEKIINLISDLCALTEQAPPIVGPRRFGNPAFRSWHTLASRLILEKLKNCIPQSCESALVELEHYLIASLGSAQRLDYGTGHELDFTAFLAGLWKLGYLGPGDEVAIVLKIYDAYFELVRKLVLTYNLEPAGSHGVWGLDDHAFLPYIFGSAQLTTYLPSLTPPEAIGDYAILNELPKPKDVVSKEICTNWTDKNLYFGAINFIHRVKSGPFWEHSPILFDISGVQKGWGKVNEGLRKMYEKEVLGKFPVVQHFWFGGLFEWNGPIHHESDGDGDVMMEGVTDSATTRAPWTLTEESDGSLPPVNHGIRVSPTLDLPDPSIAPAPWVNPAAAKAATVMPPTIAPWKRSPRASITNFYPPPFITADSRPKPIPSPSLASPALRDPLADFPLSSHTPSGSTTPTLGTLQTTAPLGPIRTNSPDSATASAIASAPQSPHHQRRPSGVAAESGDLNEIRRQHSQSRSRSRSASFARSRSNSQSQLGSMLPPASNSASSIPIMSPPLRDPFGSGMGSGSPDTESWMSTAPLGPVRTYSPDSEIAARSGPASEDMSEEDKKRKERRRSALGSGEVAVAETGDLKALREGKSSLNKAGLGGNSK